jgi:hypothetical protein
MSLAPDPLVLCLPVHDAVTRSTSYGVSFGPKNFLDNIKWTVTFSKDERNRNCSLFLEWYVKQEIKLADQLLKVTTYVVIPGGDKEFLHTSNLDFPRQTNLIFDPWISCSDIQYLCDDEGILHIECKLEYQ